VLAIIILSIPAVQTNVAQRVTKNLNETYGTHIHIKRLGLNWRGEVDIRDVYIEDHHNDTLIYASELQTNIINFQNLIQGDLGFGTIKLSDAKLNVTTYEGEETDNLYLFSQKFNTGTKTDNVFSLFSNDIELTNTRVKIINENLENPNILDLRNVNAIADNLKITGPEVKVDIKELSLIAEDRMRIIDLRANFSYDPNKLILENLQLVTENSIINGNLLLEYGENGFSNFTTDVKITATLNDSKIATNDLNTLYNEFGTDQIVSVDGEIVGTVNSFDLINADLQAGSTSLRGNYQFRNLIADSDNFSIKSNNHDINTSYYDLRRFMPRIIGNVLPVQLKDLGDFSFRGNTFLTKTDLVTNTTINSSIGGAKADLEMGNINNFQNAYYNGSIKLYDFNLGKIANSSSFGKITANLDIDGRGFTQNTVSTGIQGSISSFVFEGYQYKNINIKGNLKDPIFNGDLVIDDPNLKLQFSGLVDVSKEFNQYDFEANVEFAELNNLNLIKRDSVSVFTGKITMDMDGTTIDNAVGTISFKETFYQNERDNFYFDDFNIISSFNGDVRTISVNSPDIINGQISGEFLIRDIPNLFQNGIGNIYTNYIPREVTTNQYIDYDFTVYNKVVDLFVPQLKLGDNTRLKGSVSSDESKFKLDFRSPEILLFNNYLGNVNLQVDNDNPLYNTFISVDSVYTGFYNVIDLNIINKTLNDTLYVRSEFKGGKKKEDIFDLSLYHTINPNGKSVVGVKKSEIIYKGNSWFLNENNNRLNKVTFDDNFTEIRIDSLVLSHNEERIQMAGVIRDSTYKDLKLRFQDVNIGNIVPEIDSLRLRGNLNGNLDFLQKNGAFYPNSAITIDSVNINEIDFGDLKLDIKGNENLTKYTINTTLTNNNVKSLNAVGSIDVSPKNPQIDMDVDLNDFSLKVLSPFLSGVLSNIRGVASGNAKVSGNYKSPDINGRLTLDNAGLKIPLLNTDFDIDNNTKVDITKGQFSFKNTGLTDIKYGTKSSLDGSISHTNFQEWELDLKFETDRLLVLDTPPDEEALYYGTAFISGDASIVGPVQELVINVNATTEKGTSFKIPISDTEAIGDASFINFLSPQEKQAIISGETLVAEEVKGLSLNFELDINENAEVEVVVDKVNNSTIKGRGAGILLIEINTLGKFKMYGDFLVIDGVYDFRYGGIIQKEIEVVPGGSINWDGDPTRARLDLSAIYKTEANPAILLDNPQFNRKVPVNVIVGLSGELIQPDLSFNIEFPRVSSIVKSELDFKLQNEEQRQKQAIFLVATGSFVDDGLGGSNPYGIVVDRVSDLLNEVFADQDGKFRVGLDYSQGSRLPNQETTDRFGITLSTQISERILINGKVGVPVGGVNESSVAGDLEVQWLVNEDGSLRLNFFNRQADIQFIGEEQIFEQGVGVSYSVDFDTFSELVNKFFGKKLTREIDEELQVTPDDSSYPINFRANKEAKQEEEE